MSSPGSRSIRARATVRPPKPLSKTPMARSSIPPRRYRRLPCPGQVMMGRRSQTRREVPTVAASNPSAEIADRAVALAGGSDEELSGARATLIKLAGDQVGLLEGARDVL